MGHYDSCRDPDQAYKDKNFNPSKATKSFMKQSLKEKTAILTKMKKKQYHLDSKQEREDFAFTVADYIKWELEESGVNPVSYKDLNRFSKIVKDIVKECLEDIGV